MYFMDIEIKFNKDKSIKVLSTQKIFNTMHRVMAVENFKVGLLPYVNHNKVKSIVTSGKYFDGIRLFSKTIYGLKVIQDKLQIVKEISVGKINEFLDIPSQVHQFIIVKKIQNKNTPSYFKRLQKRHPEYNDKQIKACQKRYRKKFKEMIESCISIKYTQINDGEVKKFPIFFKVEKSDLNQFVFYNDTFGSCCVPAMELKLI